MKLNNIVMFCNARRSIILNNGTNKIRSPIKKRKQPNNFGVVSIYFVHPFLHRAPPLIGCDNGLSLRLAARRWQLRMWSITTHRVPGIAITFAYSISKRPMASPYCFSIVRTHKLWQNGSGREQIVLVLMSKPQIILYLTSNSQIVLYLMSKFPNWFPCDVMAISDKPISRYNSQSIIQINTCTISYCYFWFVSTYLL